MNLLSLVASPCAPSRGGQGDLPPLSTPQRRRKTIMPYLPSLSCLPALLWMVQSYASVVSMSSISFCPPPGGGAGGGWLLILFYRPFAKSSGAEAPLTDISSVYTAALPVIKSVLRSFPPNFRFLHIFSGRLISSIFSPFGL